MANKLSKFLHGRCYNHFSDFLKAGQKHLILTLKLHNRKAFLIVFNFVCCMKRWIQLLQSLQFNLILTISDKC